MPGGPGAPVSARVVPDIPDEGGTSASSPLLAGLEADAIQVAGRPLGFLDSALYRLNGGKAIRDVLPVHPADPPIAQGWQQVSEVLPNYPTAFGEDATLTTTPGYDDVTGLGAPRARFVTDLANH